MIVFKILLIILIAMPFVGLAFFLFHEMAKYAGKLNKRDERVAALAREQAVREKYAAYEALAQQQMEQERKRQAMIRSSVYAEDTGMGRGGSEAKGKKSKKRSKGRRNK